MALDDMYEDDSFHEAPPRQSLLPELPDDVDTGTMHSLEFGRRAYSEDPRAMFAARVSERFGDLNELGIDGEEFEVDGTFINRRRTLNADQLLEEAIDDALDDTTTEIRALTGRRDGRQSDIDLGVFGEDFDEQEEPTFRFTIPQRIRAPVIEEQGDPTMMEEDASVGAESDGYLDVEPDVTAQLDQINGGFEAVGWESDNDDGNDVDLQAYRDEASALDRSLQTETESPERPTAADSRARRQRRELKLSRSGLEYPSFPAATVKRLASGLVKSQGGNTKISKETLATLVQTTDWFFEQVGEDLAAYAQHAGRKMIEDADVVALMKRYVF
jgi:histone H3/H4